MRYMGTEEHIRHDFLNAPVESGRGAGGRVGGVQTFTIQLSLQCSDGVKVVPAIHHVAG